MTAGPARARAYAREILQIRVEAGAHVEDIVRDAARNEPAGVIAILAHAAANAISDAVTDERQRFDSIEAYITDGLEYLWKVPAPEEPDKYIIEPD